MTHNEGRSSQSDEETESSKGSCTVDKTSQSTRDGGGGKDETHWDTRTILITNRPVYKAHEDSSSDRADVGCPDLLLVKVESFLNLRHKRSDGEPDEESGEKAKPGAVEGTHVWAGEVAKLDFSGLVILVGVDIECVCLILLDFGLKCCINMNKEQLDHSSQILAERKEYNNCLQC